jgi:hypothetical protein
VQFAGSPIISKLRLFYAAMSTEFSTGAVEKCFERVARVN